MKSRYGFEEKESDSSSLLIISFFSSTQTWTFGAERKFSDSKENLATNSTSGSISPTVLNSLVSTLESECLFLID